MISNHKIIIDTNLWISFLLTKQFHFISALLNNRAVTVVFSKELWDEFIDVARRPKFKSFFELSDLKTLLEVLTGKVVYYDVHSSVSECRDKKDNFLLSLAKDSSADYLLTGDKDLLVLNPFGKTQIITIAEYRSLQAHC
jgi:putative PIN family toxin of toxin-antitoxin system